jgi:SSS family solute:Na+ symporter/sodium/pantothenate symporter
MRYIELIADRPLVWTLFLAYMVGTSWLAWLGHKKTTDIRSYAIGRGDMNPIIVGITLAASIASTATFVINPGFVYVHGVSAFMHFAVSAGAGIAAGLYLMSSGFRRIGAERKAITLPQWIGERYRSRAMTVFFAAVNLLSLCFVVLIIGGVSIVMQSTLGLSNTESLVIVTVFVFGYIFVGGTYAHAYTNTLQGIIMIVVSIVILASGLHLFSDGPGAFFDRVAAVDPNLLKPVNPASKLFGSVFTVYVAGFVIGFALVCQPHIMTKALYVKDDRAVKRYLGVTVGVSVLFMLLLLVGLFARAGDYPADIRQDLVMTVYITETFPPPVVAIITVALLAAGMSTLDGILVALSSIAANDLFLGITENNLLANKTEDERAVIAHKASRVILLAIGAIAFLIALNPPELLGIFGQVGVYGIVAASTVPILFGVWSRNTPRGPIFIAAIAGMAIHFALYLWGGIANPAVSATYGILASAAIALVAPHKFSLDTGTRRS